MKQEVPAILTKIMASPAMPRLVDELKLIWADEQARREKFYEEMDEQRKTEFINGKIFMHSPAKVRHLETVTNLVFLIKSHVKQQKSGWVASEKGLVCLSRNDYEPDIIYYGQEKAASLKSDQMKLPAPDFVAEVLSPSTEHNDRHIKFEDYADHGVKEYWIIDPEAQTIEQYVLPAGDVSGSPTAYQHVGFWQRDEKLVSIAIPGFTLSVRELFEQ